MCVKIGCLCVHRLHSVLDERLTYKTSKNVHKLEKYVHQSVYLPMYLNLMNDSHITW